MGTQAQQKTGDKPTRTVSEHPHAATSGLPSPVLVLISSQHPRRLLPQQQQRQTSQQEKLIQQQQQAGRISQ